MFRLVSLITNQNIYYFKVKQGTEETLIPIPDEKLLRLIEKSTGEDKKLEIAEKLLYQWLRNQPFFPNDYGKFEILL